MCSCFLFRLGFVSIVFCIVQQCDMSANRKRKYAQEDEDEKPQKDIKIHTKSSTTNYDKRLIVILVNASLETVKVRNV